jgi:formate/nitrite transporter
LVLLGCELATGNFALLPMGYLSGDVCAGAVLRNWAWVYLGNLLGSVGYAALFFLSVTNFGSSNGGALGDQLRHAAQAKTLTYQALGAPGLGAVFVKAMLCNWMVTIGAVLAFMSRSTIGKVIGMWLPIATFFAHGYEHSIVNMFVIPAGMLLGAPVSVSTWWLWNQIPVTIGNVVSGVLFTGAALYALNPKPRATEAAASDSGLTFGPAAGEAV